MHLQQFQVTVILSDLFRSKEDSIRAQGRGDEAVAGSVDKGSRASRDLITNVTGYEKLTEATGGLLINAAKFDVSEIVGIMGVETSTVRERWDYYCRL